MAPDILDPTAMPEENIHEQNGTRARNSMKNSQLEENNNNHKNNSHYKSHSNGSVNINGSHTKQQQTTEEKVFKPQIRWPDLIAQIFIHAGFLYGLYYLLSLQAKFYTYIWCKLLPKFMNYVISVELIPQGGIIISPS